VFDSQRTGDDTSGRSWERNCRTGVNTLAFRYPQHRRFFHLDPDCVAITAATRWEDNRMWLDLVSHCGASLFISPEPKATGKEQIAAIREAFARVAGSMAVPEDWMNNTMPELWRVRVGSAPLRKYPWCGREGTGPLEM
jgi:alpha-galactosidase